jgi:hypothetical protein
MLAESVRFAGFPALGAPTGSAPAWDFPGDAGAGPGQKLSLTRPFRGGGERTRTADFYVANVALYQLSYTPEGSARIAPTPHRPFSAPTCAFPHRRGSTTLFALVEPGWRRESALAADGLPADTLRIRWPLMTRGFRWAT